MVSHKSLQKSRPWGWWQEGTEEACVPEPASQGRKSPRGGMRLCFDCLQGAQTPLVGQAGPFLFDGSWGWGEGEGLVTHKSDRMKSLSVKPSTPTQRGEKRMGDSSRGGGSVEMSIKVTAYEQRGGRECEERPEHIPCLPGKTSDKTPGGRREAPGPSPGPAHRWG